jgi:2-keto-3-deoxy-L-rhamnonate aldolase RhmA
VKQKLVAGERVFGCFDPLSSPEVVEIIALAGFDFLPADSGGRGPRD